MFTRRKLWIFFQFFLFCANEPAWKWRKMIHYFVLAISSRFLLSSWDPEHTRVAGRRMSRGKMNRRKVLLAASNFPRVFQDICSRHCCRDERAQNTEKVLIWVIWKSFFSISLLSSHFLAHFKSLKFLKCTQKSNLDVGGVSFIQSCLKFALSAQISGDFVEISHTFDSLSTP